MKKWGDQIYAFEPINEPQYQPITEVLKKWYTKSREIVRKYNPDCWFVFHNAQLEWNPEVWNGLFPASDDRVAVDVHYYQAFVPSNSTDPHRPPINTVEDACNDYTTNIAAIAGGLNYPVWIGEWSLATDVCALWLGGFNDANTVAQQTCAQVDCPQPYMTEQAVDFDRTADMLGPFGDMRDQTTIQKGKCWTDSAFFDDDAVMNISKCA